MDGERIIHLRKHFYSALLDDKEADTGIAFAEYQFLMVVAAFNDSIHNEKKRLCRDFLEKTVFSQKLIVFVVG